MPVPEGLAVIRFDAGSARFHVHLRRSGRRRKWRFEIDGVVRVIQIDFRRGLVDCDLPERLLRWRIRGRGGGGGRSVRYYSLFR